MAPGECDTADILHSSLHNNMDKRQNAIDQIKEINKEISNTKRNVGRYREQTFLVIKRVCLIAGPVWDVAIMAYDWYSLNQFVPHFWTTVLTYSVFAITWVAQGLTGRK